MNARARILFLVFFVLLPALSCREETPPPILVPKTLSQARELALKTYSSLQGFEVTAERELSLGGYPGLRMDTKFQVGQESRRGILYLLDHPLVFNVVHFTAPDANGLFDRSHEVFKEFMRTLEPVDVEPGVGTRLEGEWKILAVPALFLELRMPATWQKTYDEDGKALVLSGPREEETWLSTITLSVLPKYDDLAAARLIRDRFVGSSSGPAESLP